MTPIARSFAYYSNKSQPGGAIGNVEIELPISTEARERKVMLHQIKVMRRTGASATNIRARLSNLSGSAAGAFEQQFRAAAATAPGLLYSVSNILAVCRTDSNGKLYLNIDGDAADTFDFELWFEVLA